MEVDSLRVQVSDATQSMKEDFRMFGEQAQKQIDEFKATTEHEL